MFLNKRTGKDTFLWFTVFAVFVPGIIMFASCRDEPAEAKPHVENLQFEKPRVNMKMGETLSVKVTVEPKEARKHRKVTYAASVEGYVTISKASSDGCVLTAEKGGTVVVVAKADSYTAYLEVIIDNEEILQVPYIMVPTQVIEVNEGSRKSVQVSLFNGNAVDNQQFNWAVEAGKDNISIMPTGNTVVVQGEKRGSQKIIVSHDKSEYTAEILVFVLGIQETVKYITTPSNIILIQANGPNKQFNVQLVNGSPTDIAGFTFEILEENPCIEVLQSNNSFNITANRAGTAVIRVHHPYARFDGVEYPLDVRVISYEAEESWIELDWNVKITDIGYSQVLNATLAGGYQENWYNKFSYELHGDEECISVQQTNHSFFIQPLAPGSCIIEIINEHIQYSREALVIVRDPAVVQPDEYYITTSQNVIQMEIGQADVQLSIQLINGNEADKNDFEWTVEDGRIIEVQALDLPLGKEVKYTTRSMKNRAQVDIKSVSNTLALITPKKTGLTRIVISHPKSSYSNATVIVKVYPRGTFANEPYIIDNPEGGLIKVDTTLPDKKVTLKMVQGDPLSVGDLEWSIANTTLATVQDMKRLENEIHGIPGDGGVTKLTVNNNNLRYPYEATVMVGTPEQLQMMSVLYVDQVYQTVAVGQSISVPILNSNMEANANGILQPNALTNSDKYELEYYDKTKVIATMIKNRLMLQGLAETTAGPIEITVKNSSGVITPATVKVMVVPGEVTIDQPYSLTGPNFVGMNYGETRDVSVGLTDATEVEKQKISWKSENATIVAVTGSGPDARLTAGQATGQANITVSHPKSVNDKIIVAYSVPPGVNPENVVVIGIAKENWLLRPGDEVMMQLITNAGDRVGDLVWEGYSDTVVSVDFNGDKAMVRAVAKGSTVITVRCRSKDYPADPTKSDALINLKIYISVSDMDPLDKSITLPSIVELIIGENKVITAVTAGLSSAEVKGITWSIDDDTVASISGETAALSGGKLFIQGKERGQAWLTVQQNDFGYVKKILVVCARTYEELMNTYVFASEESYYRLKVRDTRTVRLIFGSAGFPPDEIPYIHWSAEKNNTVKVHDGGGGDTAQIEAIGVGIATVTVTHKNAEGTSINLKDVSITFDVYDESMTGTDYKFNSSALMIGLVTSKAAETATAKNEKTLIVSIAPQGLSYSAITSYDEQFPEDGKKDEVQIHGEAVFDYLRSSNEFIITGKTKGQSYLRIQHPNVVDDLRVLVYAADSEAELNEMFPVALNKTNYVLTIGGESQYIKITLPPDDTPGYADKIKKISWSPENTAVFRSEIIETYTERKIDGIAVGNGAFSIKYNNVEVERAYISVKSKAPLDFSKRIVTESIIGMTPGETGRGTSIGSNLTGDEIALLEWKSSNPAIVSLGIVPGNNGSRLLTAGTPGEATVTVSFGQIERHIKVYVNADKDNYKAVNLDNRYYQLRKNDEMTLQAFHAALPCTGSDSWEFWPLDNHVVEMKPDGKDKVRIKGLNEGIATIILHNSDYATGVTPMSDVEFMVEVNNTAPLVETTPDDWYLTAVKTVYALDQTKTMDVTRLTVTPIRFPDNEAAQITWSVYSDEIDGEERILGKTASQLVDLYNRSGTFADISPKGRKGTAVIRADHKRSVNHIDFTIICDAQAVLVNPLPYITADQEIVKVKLYETAEITLAIENIPRSYDNSRFNAHVDNDKVQMSLNGNKVSVMGMKFGQSLITVSHPDSDIAKKIIVMVMADDNSLVYLTTRQNFSLMERNSYVALEVDMVGFTDVNNSNYQWNTVDDDLITISPSGKSAVVSSRNVTGTARITVSNRLCSEYTLTMYVRITDQLTANPVYITTGNNIISVKEGASIQIKANLVNGGAHELSQFEWRTVDHPLIELNSSGDTAMIKGLKAGTAGVTISHNSALNSITILVVVEPQMAANGIYITTDSLLVEMATSESQRLIKARLIGGEPEDVYGFRWELTSWSSIKRKEDGTGYNVVTMVGNADQCYISPYKVGNEYFEGEATLTISHPKTSYRLDVKIILQDRTDIKFSQAFVTMNQYEQVMLTMSAPSTGTLRYASGNESIVKVTGTNTMCMLDARGAGSTIVTAYNQSNTKSDEIIVRVNPVDLNNYYYLDVQIGGMSRSFLSMDIGQSPVTIQGYVRRAENDAVVAAMNSKIRWKVVKKDNRDVVRIQGATGNEWFSSINGEIVVMPLDVSGSAEIVFEYFNPSDPTNLQNEQRTLYIQVKAPASIWVLSHTIVRIAKGAAPQEVWARIDGIMPVPYYGEIDVNGNTKKEGDLRWKSTDPNKVAVRYTGPSAQKGSTAEITALDEGVTTVSVTWNETETQLITVRVEPTPHLTVSAPNITVSPKTNSTFLITGYPHNAPISYQADINNIVSITGMKAEAGDDLRYKNRPYGVPVGPGNNQGEDGDFVLHSISELSGGCGEYGFWVNVKGTDKQGIMNIVFTMVGEDRKARVTVTNMDNYAVHWVNNGYIRTKSVPDSMQSEDLKVYYTINPPEDELDIATGPTSDSTHIKFAIEKDETGKKYVRMEFGKNGNSSYNYFVPGYYKYEFKTKMTEESIFLPVYVSNPGINDQIKWEKSSTKGNGSAFDDVNYAITIAPNGRVVIDLMVNNKKGDNYLHKAGINVGTPTIISSDNSLSNSNNFFASFNSSDGQLTVRRGSGDSISTQSVLKKEYKGVLEVPYTVEEGAQVAAQKERKFLIYFAEY